MDAMEAALQAWLQSHHHQDGRGLGNRIAILKDGELVQEGTPEDILLNPANDYVQSFLQDVNRTKVLNATHAVNPARLTLTMRSRPAHALERMRAMNYEYAPVLDGKRLAGVLTAEAALRAARRARATCRATSRNWRRCPRPRAWAVLAQLVHSDQPVAVTGEDDEFIGMLSRKKVVELVTPALSRRRRRKAPRPRRTCRSRRAAQRSRPARSGATRLPDAPPARHPASLPRCASRRDGQSGKALAPSMMGQGLCRRAMAMMAVAAQPSDARDHLLIHPVRCGTSSCPS